ncbi:hypothetical protein [Bradyrhizobium prioriisuperbiae]|uniref:hypothetical protein n=1 Tax=Bradyrhizobium prioriisuperbiae TaxID=2854389 RepID=UPI0028E1D6DE|nr:hypothetical protein [Bradyrhizobium prioritasuperba]
MSSQFQTSKRVPSDRKVASEQRPSVLKLATVTEPAVVPADPVPQGMMSQPASLPGNDSMPQMLIRLTGTYNPVTPPASWRRVRRTSDAA